MRTLRPLLAAALAACALVALTAEGAWAQVEIDPTASPVQNNSPTGPLGPLPSIATIMFALGVVILIMLVVSYMRFAPRFSRDEERFKVVRADRVRVGRELPRRAVDVSQAVPVVAAPPPVPTPVGAVPRPATPPAAPEPAAAPPAAVPAPAAAAAAP